VKTAYDFVVIGGGSAGFNAARVARGLGKSVAVIDGARRLGGLCILKGCMPSKTLIYSAEVLHLAHEAAKFGLRVRDAAADMPAMHRRKLSIIRGFADHRAKQLKKGDWDLIRSNARFVDPHTVELDDGRRLRGKKFLIGTGSKVSVPHLPGLAEAKYWTSDDVLQLDSRPRSVLVLGGGIVACELAQFLARIGTRVCLVQRNPFLLKNASHEAAAVVQSAFEAEGIEVLTDTEITGIRTNAAGATVTIRRRGKTITRRADHLLNALGRDPDTSGLMLEAAGVRTDEKGGIVINRWQQTAAPHIYAAGDCCGPHQIVHIAIQQAELAARHAAGCKGLKPVDDATLLSVIFTDPQVASIGWSAHSLKKRRVPFISASYPFDDHGKSILMNATYGYVRVMADPVRGRILGAEIVGKDAGELIHSLTTPVAMKATARDMLGAPWYHPTLSEIVTYPLEEIAGKLKRPARGR
jgi:pyruvate/2-oxoglutarate dehydrogenase complex dihydrolipoamide dehydrogenase (E3) component